MAKKWHRQQVAAWADEKQRTVRFASDTHGEHMYHGFCVMNEDHSTRIPGEKLYETHRSSHHGEKGHVVKVVPQRGTRAGMVVDVSKRSWEVGHISNMRDEDGILAALKNLFGVGGWQRRK